MKYIFIYYNIAYIILLVLIYIYVQKIIKNCYKHENFSVDEDLTEVIDEASEEGNTNATQNPESESTSNPGDSPKQTPKTSRQVRANRVGGGPSKSVVVVGGGGPESSKGSESGPESSKGSESGPEYSKGSESGPESPTGGGPESSSGDLITKDEFNKLLRPAGSDKVLSGGVIDDTKTVVIEEPTKNVNGNIPVSELTNSNYNYKFKQESQIISGLRTENKPIIIDDLKQGIEDKVDGSG